MLQKSFERQNILKLEGEMFLCMETYSSVTADTTYLILTPVELNSAWKKGRASSQKLIKQRYISFHTFCIWLDKSAKIGCPSRYTKAINANNQLRPYL